MTRPSGGDSVASMPPVSPAPAPASECLTRGELFARRPPVTTIVAIPGWGSTRVTSLTQGQWEDLNARHQKDGKTDTSRGYMVEAVAAALVGPDGGYMFTDPAEGGKLVRDLPLPVVAQLFAGVAQQSGLTAEAREDLGKASGPTPAAGT